ncbi:hypothetical protein CN958_30665 [Bacillus cereus]|uniref:Uncharacterized protein n=1 Tax=Bacillus cereus TaxID=1396 RepID=A0A2B9DJI3_BACCE|nr:hypothetical protein CN958_30665 [Bacillus cereus]
MSIGRYIITYVQNDKKLFEKSESFYSAIGPVCGIRLAGSLFENVESLQSYKDFIETLTI